MSNQQEYFISEVRSLAERISQEEASIINLKENFTKLLDIWHEIPSSLKPTFKNLINTYHLTPLMITSLSKDILNLPNDWQISVALTDFISQMLDGIDDEKRIEMLLAMLESSFSITLNLAKFCVEVPEIEEGIQLLMKIIKNNLEHYPFIITEVLQSEIFLQILLTDVPSIVLSIFSVLLHILQYNSQEFFQMNEGTLMCILDEIVYKLSFSSDHSIIRVAIIILLTLLEVQPDMINVVSQRFQGLQYLLDRWKHQEFHHEVTKLSNMLNRSLHLSRTSKDINKAATVIQAFWRGYCVRKNVKDLKAVVITIQQHFRMRKQKKLISEQLKQGVQSTNFITELKLKQTHRKLKEKRLRLLEILPAEHYQQYLNDLETYAAIVIQKTWRGYYSRTKLAEKNNLRREKAAYVIQKWFRKCLQHRKRNRHKNELWKNHLKITEEKWKVLQYEIEKWQNDNKIKMGSRTEEEEKHRTVQELLSHHYLMEFNLRQQDNHRELILAELECDADLLLGAPSLDEITLKDVTLFKSVSQASQAQAKLMHRNELLLCTESWRKTFNTNEDNYFI